MQLVERDLMSRSGWIRVVLIGIGLLGGMHFTISLCCMELLWQAGAAPWDWKAVQFSIPYIIVLMVFIAGLSFACDKKQRTSTAAIILGVAVAASILLFVYDVANDRRQHLGGSGSDPIWLIWWWLNYI